MRPAAANRRTSTLLGAGTLLAAAALALAGCAGGPGPAGSAAVAGTGQGYVAGDGTITRVAPADRGTPRDLAGTTLDGKRWRLADHAGKVVVVNVWASWCGPCRDEAPALEGAWRATRSRGVEFVGLNVRDDRPPAEAFVRKFGLSYPSVVDQDGRLVLAFRDSLPPNAVPSTLVLDRQGRVAARVLGKTTEPTLRALIDDVLSERAT
jgi:thiol-disulfide isomerase/thioredoxin